MATSNTVLGAMVFAPDAARASGPRKIAPREVQPEPLWYTLAPMQIGERPRVVRVVGLLGFRVRVRDMKGQCAVLRAKQCLGRFATWRVAAQAEARLRVAWAGHAAGIAQARTALRQKLLARDIAMQVAIFDLIALPGMAAPNASPEMAGDIAPTRGDQ